MDDSTTRGEYVPAAREFEYQGFVCRVDLGIHTNGSPIDMFVTCNRETPSLQVCTQKYGISTREKALEEAELHAERAIDERVRDYEKLHNVTLG